MTEPRTNPSTPGDVRQQLIELGFVVNAEDDLTTAICAFQQQRGLVVDGHVGPMTRRALSEASHKPVSYTHLTLPTTF